MSCRSHRLYIAHKMIKTAEVNTEVDSETEGDTYGIDMGGK